MLLLSLWHTISYFLQVCSVRLWRREDKIYECRIKYSIIMRSDILQMGYASAMAVVLLVIILEAYHWVQFEKSESKTGNTRRCRKVKKLVRIGENYYFSSCLYSCCISVFLCLMLSFKSNVEIMSIPTTFFPSEWIVLIIGW